MPSLFLVALPTIALSSLLMSLLLMTARDPQIVARVHRPPDGDPTWQLGLTLLTAGVGVLLGTVMVDLWTGSPHLGLGLVATTVALAGALVLNAAVLTAQAPADGPTTATTPGEIST